MGGMNSKLHTVTDALGRPLRMFLTADHRSDYIGARALLDGLPPAKHMLADRDYDADWDREALEESAMKPCIPSRKGRKAPILHDEARDRQRQQDREQLCLPQGLATRRNPLRQMPEGLPVSSCSRRPRHGLVVNPDPRSSRGPSCRSRR
jgi:IS5 family transposase